LVGSHQDNSDDQIARGRIARGAMFRRTILTEDAVRDIRSGQHTQAFYAEKYGVAEGTIQDVVEFKTWKHVR
jgi:hypothetical protein